MMNWNACHDFEPPAGVPDAMAELRRFRRSEFKGT